MSERSERLALDLGVTGLSGPARVLAQEAVRIVERLDHLDESLRGDPHAWLDIVTKLPDTVAEVVIDKLLAEVRQQGLALATVLKSLHAIMGGEVAARAPANTADALAAKRKERREAAQQAAAGSGGS